MKNKKIKYYMITIGCQMNKSDSERIAGYLENNGCGLAVSSETANLVVLNTCGVRQSAEDRVYGLVGRIKKANPEAKLVITGCLSEREDVKKRLKGKVDFWLPIYQITNRGSQKKDYLCIKPKYNSKISAFVPIGNGCNNFCAYCVVPYARGREIYRPADEILAEVEFLVNQGYKEIILIAQNVNSYVSKIPNYPSFAKRNGAGKLQILNKFQIPNPKNINFATLLKMVNDIPGKFWVRFATSHPKDMSEELIRTVASCGKVCGHIHLPAQSGDNKILKKMNRGYSRKEYIKLINKIRGAINRFQITNHKSQINSKFKIQNSKLWWAPIAITTDIIVGFPGETRKQFNNTAKLFREVKFDMAYIARYSPRPGTAAFKLKDNVPLVEKKRREEELIKILRKTALENNKKYIGNTVEVLIEGKNKKGEWQGKARTGKTVKFRVLKAKRRIGELAIVKIKEAEDFGLAGVVIK